jgi:hypothetical protein
LTPGPAARVRIDNPEQRHREPIERGERAFAFIRTVSHGLLEPGPHAGIAVSGLKPRRHVIDHVSPLAERREVVEALEDEIDAPEILAQFAILQPIIDERAVCFGLLAIEDRLHADIEPGFEGLAGFTGFPISVANLRRGRKSEAENRIETGAVSPDRLWNGVARLTFSDAQGKARVWWKTPHLDSDRAVCPRRRYA